jgi:hypothetical protein
VNDVAVHREGPIGKRPDRPDRVEMTDEQLQAMPATPI